MSDQQRKRQETLAQIAALTKLIQDRQKGPTPSFPSSSRYHPYKTSQHNLPNRSSIHSAPQAKYQFSKNKTLICVSSSTNSQNVSGNPTATNSSTTPSATSETRNDAQSSSSSSNAIQKHVSYIQSRNKLVRVDSDAYRAVAQKQSQASQRNSSSTSQPSITQKRVKPSAHKKLIVIDGKTFTSSGNKLQNAALGPLPTRTSVKKKTQHISGREKKIHVIQIGEVEFIVDPKRRKLIRKDSTADIKSTPSKLVMNGKQYVRSKRGNLILKTTKDSNKQIKRAKMNKTWNRSSSTKSSKTKKAKGHCSFYRFGKCTKGSDCRFIHDPRYVAPCPNILKSGNCTTPDCPLAHTILDETRPFCLHFERGRCFRDECPYFHVKLSQDAGICPDFARTGYCANGKRCSKKHFYMCPEFEATGSCSKEAEKKKCPLPHVSRYRSSDSKKNLSAKRKGKSVSTEKEDTTTVEDQVQLPIEPESLEIFDDQEHDQDYHFGSEEMDQDSDEGSEDEEYDSDDADSEIDDDMLDEGQNIISEQPSSAEVNAQGEEDVVYIDLPEDSDHGSDEEQDTGILNE